jgi:hypothetical protein
VLVLLFVGCPVLPPLTADEAMARVAAVTSLTERYNLAVALYPYVVDKDNWSILPVPPPRYERVVVAADGAYLEVRPGPGLTPVLCLRLQRIPAPVFAGLLDAIKAESLRHARPLRLQRLLRNWMFTSAQIRDLLALMEYREETTTAGTLLRPRTIEPQLWNKEVCAKVKDFDDCALD